MKADDRLSMYRLVDRLGKGGFAEVWRARPEPAQALALRSEPSADPAALARWLRTLTEILLVRDGPHVAARPVVHHLAQVIDALDANCAATASAPSSLRGNVDDLVRDALRWVEELAASGDLDVALKIPFHDGYVRQMRREKDILRHVPHPRLVRQLELDLASEPPFLAMELVRGWSLREALKTEPLPPMAKILAVMDQLLTVLEHLHRRGMVHGDVKPENIMLEPDGSLRLIDLGLGQVSQAVLRDAYLSLSMASRVPLQGTLSYMAPEVRRGDVPGPAADLFSAGILLYEMLVGDVPHGMTLPSEAATQRELTPRFDVLLKWVLHPEPTRRIPSARELRERVLITMRERTRHKLGTGVKRGVAREGTLSFDQWALEHASPFVAGDWLGDYQLEEPLGRGGFGEVWKGRKAGAPDHEAVALKIAIGPHGKDALVREGEVTGRLDHPQIPRLLAGALDHDPPYLAIEFVPGRSLRARMNADGPMSPGDAMTSARSLIEALAHCHARGVVHRDLKPENLLLAEPALTLHLLDFGLASAAPEEPARRAELSRSLQSGDVGGGTYEYMAPERRRGEPGGTPADVYAVGAIVYEALTLELPRGLTRLRELCPAAPGGLEALVERLLDADPARRPTLVEAKAALERERPRDDVRARTRTRGAPGRARALDVRVALAVGAVALLLLVGVGLLRTRTASHGATDDPVARLALLVRQTTGAPKASVDHLRAWERELVAAIDVVRAHDPKAAARAELRLARVGALRRRREEAIALAEQASWRLSRARTSATRLRDAPGASLESIDAARAALGQLADGTALLERALALDPTCPLGPGWRRDVTTSAALEARWRAEVFDKELFAARRAAGSGNHDELRTIASLLVEQLEAGAVVVDPRLSGLGPEALGWIAAAYERRIAQELEARRLSSALMDWQRLTVLGGTPGLQPTTTREATARRIAEVALRAADGRQLVALAALPGVTPAASGAMLEDAARLLPPAEGPWRALARARGAREAEGLDPATCLGRARRLMWEELDAPDHALAMAELAARTSPGRPEVQALLAACQALVGDAIAGRATSRRAHLSIEPAIARFEAARAARGARRAPLDEELALELEAAGWALRDAVDLPDTPDGFQ